MVPSEGRCEHRFLPIARQTSTHDRQGYPRKVARLLRFGRGLMHWLAGDGAEKSCAAMYLRYPTTLRLARI